MPSFVALAISVPEIPVVGSSAAVLKAFLMSLMLKIYEVVHITNNNVAITELGSQTGISPFVPLDGAIPAILNFDVLRDVTVSVVPLDQLTAAGVPGFQPLPAPAIVVAPVVVGPTDIVQRVQLLAHLQSAGYVVDANTALNFAQGLSPLPPAAAASPTAVVANPLSPVSASQGIDNMRFRCAVAAGVIDPLFANRVGGTVFKTVITTLVKEFMRQFPTATNDSVNLITEQQCLDLCMVCSWSPELAKKFNTCLNSPQRRNSADSGIFKRLILFLPWLRGYRVPPMGRCLQ
jgi:hypothetical protein